MYFRKDGKSYLKPGVTDYKDVLSRIEANSKYDPVEHPERVTWREYFNEIRPAKSITVKGKEHALMIEQELLQALGPADASFDRNFSGISEVRNYTPQRYAIAVNILEKYRTKWQ